MKAMVLTRTTSRKRALLLRALAGALAALAALAALPQKAEAGVFIGVGVSVGVPPPPLPVYEQPPIPGPGYIWTPGYWAWDGAEYYWVPGTWVLAPFYGALWTPCYWGWEGGAYVFHPGYWGRHVGFYGGIDYGWGYTGAGYAGGYWGPHGFYYNRAVNRIDNVHITNVYNRTVVNNVNVTRVSYNGGRGGVMARATPQQLAYARQARMGPIAAQQRQMNLASRNPAMHAPFNHGNPPIAATTRPGVFNAGAVPAHGAPFTPAAFGAQRAGNNVVHAPQGMQPNNGMALHSASFAPHAGMPAAMNAGRPGGSGGNSYHPGSAPNVAPAGRAMQPLDMRTAHAPVDGYRGPSTAYRPAPAAAYHPAQATAYHPTAAPAYHPQPQFRPQPAYRAPMPQYRAPAPQYHAYRPAPAPRPMGGAAPRGGGHDMHHG